MKHGEVLAFGQFQRRDQERLTQVADEASCALRLLPTAKDASEYLNQFAPQALLVDGHDNDAEQLCLQVRSYVTHTHTPIISLNRQLDDLSFAEIFNWGGDDAVELSLERPLLTRMRLLPKAPPNASAQQKGLAIVADADRCRRLVRARVLRNAGYAIQFAANRQELRELAGTRARLVVIDSELEDSSAQLIDNARRAPRTVHILLAPPRDLASHGQATRALPNVAVTDSFAPPENIVFLVNELERGGASDQRASRRLLYGTKVEYRGAGLDHGDIGYCYNISEGGLYVRTLAPPEYPLVWLELTPPRTERRVRLEGEVVWRRPYGPCDGATAPPGFGVKIVDATTRDRAAWCEGYAQFAAALGLN